MEKGADAYRSIGEAAKLVGVAPHVLRYWESQFPQLKPVRRPDGRRYYRPDDVRLAAGLAEVLREDGLTTRGAARLIARDGGADLRARGAARLPDAFALNGAAGDPMVADRAEARPAPAKPAAARPVAARPVAAPAKPRAAARPRKAPPPAAEALPLFPDAPPAADSRPAPPPLARLSHLAANLHRAALSQADLRAAVAGLRAHLAQRG